MADSKRRFLVVPDKAWADATLVSATSQAGLTVQQPTQDTAEGDLRILVSGEPTTEAEYVVSMVRAGVSEDARFTFRDTLAGDIKVKQSPSVLAGRPDVIDGRTGPYPVSTSSRYVTKPSGCLSPDGREVITYLRTAADLWSARFFDRGLVTIDGIASAEATTPYVAVFDPSSVSWDIPAPLGISFPTLDEDLPARGVDIIWSAELQRFLLVAMHGWHLVVYTLTENLSGGAVLRRAVDLTLAVDALSAPPFGKEFGCDTGATLSLQSLPSGRLVLLVATGDALYSLLSDDLGLSWTPSVVTDYGSSLDGSGAVVSYVGATVTPSGALVCALNHGDIDGKAGYSGSDVVFPLGGNRVLTRIYTSLSGETWSGGLLDTEEAYIASSVAVLPDGDVWLYSVFLTEQEGPEGDAGGAGYANRSVSPYLATRRLFGPRFGVIADLPAQIPSAAYAGSNAFSCSPAHWSQAEKNANLLSQGEFGISGVLGGVFALANPGHISVLVGLGKNTRSGGYGETITFDRSGLLCLRANYTTDLLENLAFSQNIRPANTLSYGSTVRQTPGRSYNATWDAWDFPEHWSYAKTAAGGAVASLVTVSDGDVAGGYMETTASATDSLYWTKHPDSFPNAGGLDGDPVFTSQGEGMASISRFFLYVESGGNVLTDEIVYRLSLADRNRAFSYALRFEVSGGNLEVALYDDVAAASLVFAVIPGGAKRWVEIVVSTSEENIASYYSSSIFADAYWRFPDETQDWQEPYSAFASKPLSVGASAAVDVQEFGHKLVVSSAVSVRWKGVHLHRPNHPMVSASRTAERHLAQGPVVWPTASDWALQYLDNPLIVGATPEQTSIFGVDTYHSRSVLPLRAGGRPVYLSDGLYLSAAGRATSDTGTFEVSTDHVFSATNVLPSMPVSREWRALSDTEASLSFLAQRLYLRDIGLSVFGRNAPVVRLEIADNPAFVSPAVDLAVTVPGAAASFASTRTEHAHLWATSAGSGVTVTKGHFSVSLDRDVWRPHQFCSQETGQRFYLNISDGSTDRVYRVLDNTANTLKLSADPQADPGGDLSVYSDRFAFDISDLLASIPDPAPLTPYVRVTLGECSYMDGDEQFHRLGALWFGELHDLSEPDFDWQWSRSTASGNTLTDTPAGPTYSKRNRQFRRSFTASKPLMKSALVSDGVDSPTEQIRGSWEEFVNLMERLEVDGTRCALIWQGERAEAGAQVDPTQRTADPLELIACRVQSAGTLQNEQYSCQTMTLASTGETSVPRPRASNQQIVFREEF